MFSLFKDKITLYNLSLVTRKTLLSKPEINIEFIPNEILVEIIANLDILDLLNLCQTYKKLENLCQDVYILSKVQYKHSFLKYIIKNEFIAAFHAMKYGKQIFDNENIKIFLYDIFVILDKNQYKDVIFFTRELFKYVRVSQDLNMKETKNQIIGYTLSKLFHRIREKYPYHNYRFISSNNILYMINVVSTLINKTKYNDNCIEIHLLKILLTWFKMKPIDIDPLITHTEGILFFYQEKILKNGE